jgi:ankyrin repeat protein
VAQVLLDAGLDVNVKDEQGHTPLTAAASWRRDSMVEWLTARGGSP